MYEKLFLFLLFIPILVISLSLFFLLYLYLHDKYQSQHAVIRTHPLLGRLRYLFEFIGKPFRQYWFNNDKEGKPIDRDTAETIAKASKYGNTIKSFGSVRDFDEPGFYLVNSMFPKNVNELKVDNKNKTFTYQYKIIKEGEFSRKEIRISKEIDPWYLEDNYQITIGKNSKYPFTVKGLVGVSAMSFGALSSPAVRALAQGVSISGGSWMNTGEGGISRYHLSKMYEATNTVPSEEKYKKIYRTVTKKQLISNFDLVEIFGEKIQTIINEMVEKGFLTEKGTDLIFQIGSGLFGARDSKGNFSDEKFKENALRPEVKAIEIKLAQGAKTKGGHVEGVKVTPEIAEIRGIEPWKTVDSPNRFKEFHDIPSLFLFIDRLKSLSEKPVGIKVVIGNESSLDELASYMSKTGKGPDFITVDGGNGGTGATYQEMADSLGLPVYSAVAYAHNSLIKHGVRDRVVVIASGMLATSDKMAIALGLGADLVNIARAAMNTIGCINAQKCSSNECPVGITSHKEHLQRGLVVEEKRFRTANYLTTMRQGLFTLAAACGIESPTLFCRDHVTYKQGSGKINSANELF